MRVVWPLLFVISIPTIAIVLLFTDPGSTTLCGTRPVVVSAANASAFDARLQRLAVDLARALRHSNVHGVRIVVTGERDAG